MKKQNEKNIFKNFVNQEVFFSLQKGVPFSTEFSRKQFSQAIMKKQGVVILQSQGVVVPEKKSGGLSFSNLKGVVVPEKKSGGCYF